MLDPLSLMGFSTARTPWPAMAGWRKNGVRGSPSCLPAGFSGHLSDSARDSDGVGAGWLDDGDLAPEDRSRCSKGGCCRVRWARGHPRWSAGEDSDDRHRRDRLCSVIDRRSRLRGPAPDGARSGDAVAGWARWASELPIWSGANGGKPMRSRMSTGTEDQSARDSDDRIVPVHAARVTTTWGRSPDPRSRRWACSGALGSAIRHRVPGPPV